MIATCYKYCCVLSAHYMPVQGWCFSLKFFCWIYLKFSNKTKVLSGHSGVAFVISSLRNTIENFYLTLFYVNVNPFPSNVFQTLPSLYVHVVILHGILISLIVTALADIYRTPRESSAKPPRMRIILHYLYLLFGLFLLSIVRLSGSTCARFHGRARRSNCR